MLIGFVEVTAPSASSPWPLWGGKLGPESPLLFRTFAFLPLFGLIKGQGEVPRDASKDYCQDKTQRDLESPQLNGRGGGSPRQVLIQSVSQAGRQSESHSVNQITVTDSALTTCQAPC